MPIRHEKSVILWKFEAHSVSTLKIMVKRYEDITE